METMLEILDAIGDGRSRFEAHGPGTVLYSLVFITGYNYNTISRAIRELEDYNMIQVERLSHDYPCQHNFICWIRRRGKSQWLAAPARRWGQTAAISTTRNKPYLAAINGERVA